MTSNCPDPKHEQIEEKSDVDGIRSVLDNLVSNVSDRLGDRNSSICTETLPTGKEIHSPIDRQKKKDFSTSVVPRFPIIIRTIDQQLRDILRLVRKHSRQLIIVGCFLLLIVSSIFFLLVCLTLREKSVLLAEKFLQTDFNTPKDLIRTKTALVKICSAIIHSQLE
jgi:hypothetical protein